MRSLGSFMVCGLLAWSTMLLAEESPLAKKLAESNLKLDEKALEKGYAPLPDPGNVLPGATAGFVNRTTGAVVVIAGADVSEAEKADFEDNEPTRKLIEAKRDILKRNTPDATLEPGKLRQVNGFTYIALEYSRKLAKPVDGMTTAHAFLCTTIRDGWGVTVFAVAKYATDTRDAADDVLVALQPLRQKGALHPGTFEDYQAKVHGFTTRLREAAWQKWPHGSEYFPGAFLTGRRGDASFLAIFVFPLPEKGLTLNDHFVVAMRTCTRFSSPEQEFKVNPAKMAGFDEALKFGGDVETSSSSSYFGGWFGKGGGRMMLTVTWTDKSKAKDARAEVASTLACIEPLSINGAPPLSTYTPAQRQTQSAVLNEIAARLLRHGRNEDAASAFDMALACSHTDIATLEAAVLSMQQTGDPKFASLLLSRYWDDFKDSPRAWLLRAKLRREAGEKDKAVEDFAAAFNTGLRDENTVLQYLSLLWELERFEDARTFIDDYGKKHPSARVERWHAATLGRLKQYDKALALYAKLVEPRPLDAEAAMQYAEFANQAGKHELALQLSDMLIHERQDTPRVRLIEGWAHYGLKDWREAKVSFEVARNAAPNDPSVLDALNSANSALGEGDSSAVKKVIEALVLPAAVKKRVDKAVAEFKPVEDEGGVSLIHTTQISFHKNKPTTTTVHRKIKVLDTSGVDVLSTLDIPFDPLAERVFVNQLSVLDEQDKVVTRGKPEDQYVTDPSMDGPATLGRVLRVPVPGLKPGRTLEYVYTKRTVDADKTLRFDTTWFGSSYPSAAQAVVVEGDVKEVHAEMNDALKASVEIIEDKAAGTRAWFLAPAPQFHSEPYLPRFSAFSPVLWLGTPDGDWAEVGKEYLDLIKEQLKPEPETEALAKKLVESTASEEQKIDRLSRFVREEITYKAIEFGRRARIPNRPSRVTANHYGDCKDMALLLHHLLRAVGIESHLTLINNRVDLAASLPDLDQFNHMILHVPSLKAQFVDCTEGKSAGVNLPPSLFQLQGFVLDPAKPRLMPMPKREDWPVNKLTIDRVVRFDSEGSADVADTLEFGSYLAQGMRMFLNSLPPQRRVDSMQSWLHRASRWQLEKMEALELTNPSAPLTLKLRYSIPPPALPGSRSVQVPAVMEEEYLDINYLRHRYHPFETLHPLEISTNVQVIANTPIDPSSLRALSRASGESKYCTWDMRATADPQAGNECRLKFSALWPATAGGPAEYSAMRKAAAAAASAWEVPLRLGEAPITSGQQ